MQKYLSILFIKKKEEEERKEKSIMHFVISFIIIILIIVIFKKKRYPFKSTVLDNWVFEKIDSILYNKGTFKGVSKDF